MPAELETVTVKLKEGEEDRVAAGHQWVFSNEIEGVTGPAEAGAEAVLTTSRGTPMGVGFYHPNSLIAWRLVSRRPQSIGADLIRGRLEAALKLRERLYPGERSYRLCFGESDGLPGLVADRYEDVVVLQVLSAGIEKRLDLVAEALDDLFKPKGVYLKNDHPARRLEGLSSESRAMHGDVPPRVVIEEGGLKFVTPVTEGQKTGFYFDQRENRAFLRPYFKNRNILDLYCYTGGFALNAAKHGAARVLALDSSGPAVALAKESAALNAVPEDRCQFDEGDAEEVLQAFAHERQAFVPDMVLLDPPSFVPSKKHLEKAMRAYGKINTLGLKCLKAGGLLATSTCSHHVDREGFVRMLREAAGKAGKSVRLIELRAQAKDHPILLAMPETEYLHFALLEVL